MIPLIETIGRQALFAFDPETAHGLSIAALRSGVPLCSRPYADPRLAVTVAGLRFPNPLGMAAGYDKNAEVPDPLLRLGFGFAEVGTVTPLPQTGNPRPRIFRLTRDEAVINRLGFNNEGFDTVERRIAARRGKPGIVGINVGANKDSADRIADYEQGVRRFAALASYLTINISSPNTVGLRGLQARESLAELLARVKAARAGTSADAVPIFLKIAPDLSEEEMDDIASVTLESELEGLIVSNTTLSRQGLASQVHVDQAGGLSGQPLFARSTAVLARMRRRVGNRLSIVGAGGVASAEQALEKIRAGADLVQLYTGMIYAGPSLPGRIVAGLSAQADREGFSSLADIRGQRLDHWASTPLGT